MLRKLAISAVLVAVCATVVQADLVSSWMPTKDTGITKPGSEALGSNGAGNQTRAGKNRENYFLMQFPWADIDAYMAPFRGQPGITIQVKLSIMSRGDNNATANIRPTAIVNATTDWAEGDGTNLYHPNFTVTSVTSFFAQTDPAAYVYDPGDPNAVPPVPPSWTPPPTGVGPWPWGEYDSQRLQPELINPVSMNIPMDTPANTRLFVGLAPNFYNRQIAGSVYVAGYGNTLNIYGIYLFDISGAGNNGTAYTREQGFDSAPWITVTIIPEPASMVLLVMGGVGLLLRKRR